MRTLLHTRTFCAAVSALGQGTFLFDQQSSADETTPSGGTDIHLLLPHAGQSFTPAFSGIDFVRLMFDDGSPGDAQGATLYVNLRSQSITGPTLGTSTPVSMPDGFAGAANFVFPSTIPLNPGTQYYLEFVLTAGMTPWNTLSGSYNYPGGIAYANGNPYPGADYWFREGIFTVPEPAPVLLALVGAGVFVLGRSGPRSRPRG